MRLGMRLTVERVLRDGGLLVHRHMVGRSAWRDGIEAANHRLLRWRVNPEADLVLRLIIVLYNSTPDVAVSRGRDPECSSRQVN